MMAPTAATPVQVNTPHGKLGCRLTEASTEFTVEIPVWSAGRVKDLGTCGVSLALTRRPSTRARANSSDGIGARPAHTSSNLSSGMRGICPNFAQSAPGWSSVARASRAGMPTIRAPGRTSFSTTAFAPIVELSLTVIAPRTRQPAARVTPLPMRGNPVSFFCPTVSPPLEGGVGADGTRVDHGSDRVRHVQPGADRNRRRKVNPMKCDVQLTQRRR